MTDTKHKTTQTASRHTAGPWIHRIDEYADGSKYLITDADGDAVAVASPLVAKDDCTRGDFPERDANARLIAAAPELLEALGAILSDADTISFHTPHLGHDYWDKARNVIAKATERVA